MRDFFELELGRLHLTTGLQQLSKLSDAEYTELLDLLCAECDRFPLIPNKDKQEYIQEFMVSDPEFLGFNKKILWKWFNVVNKRYIVGQCDYQEKQPETDNRTPEEIAKVQEIAKTYMASLVDFKPTYPHLEQDMKAIQREDQERQEGKKAVVYKTPTSAEITKRELHDRWIRENHDLLTGARLACWTPESEWLELRTATAGDAPD